MLRTSVLLFLLGLLVYLFFYGDSFLFEPKDRERLGQVVSVDGMVLGKTPWQDSFTNTQLNSSIYDGQKILTGFNSSLKLKLGQEAITIGESSSLLFNKRANKIHVSVEKGKVTRSELSPLILFWVDGKEIKKLIVENRKFAETTQAIVNDGTVIGKTSKEDSLLQNQMDQTFKLHQRFLEKCYIKYYEKTGGQTQEVTALFRFAITPRGRTDEIQLLQSTASDEAFQNCLSEVISRVRFKNYQGARRVVEFPFKFSPPQ